MRPDRWSPPKARWADGRLSEGQAVGGQLIDRQPADGLCPDAPCPDDQCPDGQWPLLRGLTFRLHTAAVWDGRGFMTLWLIFDLEAVCLCVSVPAAAAAAGAPRLTVSGDDLSGVQGGSWPLRSREEEVHLPCCVKCLAYAPLIDLYCVSPWMRERMILVVWM